MSFNDDWNKVKLGEIGNITTGDTNTQDAVIDGDYPLFDRSKKIKKSNKYLFDEEAVIVPGEGKEFKPRYYSGKFDLHQRAYAIWSNSDSLLNKFLYYVMFLKNEILKKRAVGSTVKSLRMGLFEELDIPIPSLNEQKTIINILSSFDNKIENNNKMNKTLEEMAQTIYKSWFVDFEPFQDGEFVESKLGEIPEQWKVKKIKEISDVVLGKTPSTRKEENYGEKYPFVRIPEMHDKIFIVETEKKLSEIGHKSQENKLIPENSIMVSCIGTVGLVSLNFKPSHTNQQINTIVCDDELVEYLYFRMKNMRRKLIKIGSSGTTMGNINKGTFQKIKVVIPDKDTLIEFHKTVKPLFNRIKLNLQENQALKELRDSLLLKLMSGEIRVPLDEDAKEVN